MADKEVQEDAPKKSGKGLIIILIVVIVLLIAGMGALAYLLLAGDHKGDEKGSQTAEAHATAEGQGAESGHGKQYSPKYKQFEAPPPDAEPEYFTMDKFVVNFYGDGKAKFLAIDMKFMSYYPQVVGEKGEMEHLRPILRNDIESLLRKQHYNDLNKPDGPDKLRKEILEITKKVLEKHEIFPDLLENVYFTRFVMQ